VKGAVRGKGAGRGKVGIVGIGAVGQACAYALVLRGSAREIVLVDKVPARAAAVAADMRYGAPLSPAVEITSGQWPDLAGATVVLICAGLNEKAGGATDRDDARGRLKLLEPNAAVYRDAVPRIVAAAPAAVLVAVTDPPDPLAGLTRAIAGHERVLGTGTVIDTLRFRVHIAAELGVHPSAVDGLVVGEHGTSQVMLWSSVRVAGTPIAEGLSRRDPRRSLDELREQVDRAVRFANITIIEGNDASRFGIGAVCARIAEAILCDERVVLPVAAHRERYGVTVALPTVVGRQGPAGDLLPSMSNEERRHFEQSVEAVRDAARGLAGGPTCPDVGSKSFALARTVAGVHEGDGMAVSERDMSADGLPEPIRGDEGATILGPRNVPLERENPSLLVPPRTDHGTVPNLKFSYAAAHNRVLSGGWAREVTARELPIATELAGVNMRLKPGGIRELHWHKEAEWAYMLAGRVRVTGVDAEGRNFIDDVGAGDIWNFPAGIPHSLQALEEGAEFLLVFDDGNFSENATFLITEWFELTPRDVLAKNFGVPETAFANLPSDVDYTRYIFNGDIPPPLEEDAVDAPAGRVPNGYTYRLQAQQPLEMAGGRVRIVDSSSFPAASTIAAALVEVEPGALRELHWHTNTDEWQYYIGGQGRMTVFASSGKARTFDYQAGDVGYVPFAMGHYIENTGDEPLRFLEMFRSDRFADISLSQWMALTPPALVRAHLNLDPETIAALPREKPVIVR
jgi:oxalate decarboxylase